MPGPRASTDGWASSLPWVVIGLAVGFVVSQLRRQRPGPEPKAAPARVSRAVELVEAPGWRPRRYCARCGASVSKRNESDRIWIRIEGEQIHYLHERCADERGDPL